MKVKPSGLLKQIKNQIDSVTEKPTRFFAVTGSCTFNIHGIFFSVDGFLNLSVTTDSLLTTQQS